MATITVELTVPEALYAMAALGRSANQARSAKSGDDWLDQTAVTLYAGAQRKLELALYPEVEQPVQHFRGDWEDVPVAQP